MANRIQISAIVVLGVLIAVALEAAYTQEFHIGVLVRVFAAASFVNALVFLFDRYLWKLSWLHGWFVNRPDISGSWDVKITPLTADPSIGKPRSRRSYRYQIHQTYSDLFIRMVDGPESQGESVVADLKRSEDGSFELISTYRNEPSLKLRERSEIHTGTVRLRVDQERMVGSYWTDRPTRGEVEAVRSSNDTM